MGALTCLTGDGDCCRPTVTLATADGAAGVKLVSWRAALDAVLWARSSATSAPSACISRVAVLSKLASVLWGQRAFMPNEKERRFLISQDPIETAKTGKTERRRGRTGTRNEFLYLLHSGLMTRL